MEVGEGQEGGRGGKEAILYMIYECSARSPTHDSIILHAHAIVLVALCLGKDAHAFHLDVEDTHSLSHSLVPGRYGLTFAKVVPQQQSMLQRKSCPTFFFIAFKIFLTFAWILKVFLQVFSLV